MDAVRELSAVAAPDFPDQWYEITAEGHFWLEWRCTAFLAQLADLGLPRDAPWRGLDIGCGHGVVRRQIERATAWTTDGADLHRGALAQNHGTRGDTLLYDVHDRRPELAGRYDFVVLFDVLEHVADPHAFLASVLHHLRPGGWLFVNVPALACFTSRYDRAVGHLRRYGKGTLRAELAPLPLALRDLRYWGASMLPYLAARTLMSLREASVEKVIARGVLPPAAWMQRWILRVMRVETACLRRPALGTSLLAAAVRTDGRGGAG